MAYKHFTACYLYPAGGKPYNQGDRIAFLAGRLLLAAVVAGTFVAFGLIAGPIGAIIGGILGSVVGFTDLLDTAADQWLNHRLICLDQDNPCAVGVVSYDPTRGDLGAFDNDRFFDVVLMPHPTETVEASDQAFGDIFDDDIKATNKAALVPKNRYDANGDVVVAFRQHVLDHDKNDILTDEFQGQQFLKPRADIFNDLGYDAPHRHERTALHCEAEGDFWVRIKKFAPALAALMAAALVATAAGAAAGSAAGAAAGCAIGSFFFGPIGCAIGSFFGSLLGGAAGAAAAGAASYFLAIGPILQAIFDAGIGDVEDANVGDKALGPIHVGDTVAVMGEHVYDGYHAGWHEFHPLKAVVKIAATEFYLRWQPEVTDPSVPQLPPGETVVLSPDDMRQGLNSPAFRTRCENLRRTWCAMLNDAFDPETREKQQRLEERWTIHPTVDGCRPAGSDPGDPH